MLNLYPFNLQQFMDIFNIDNLVRCVGAYDVKVIVVGSGHSYLSSNYERDWFSHSANTFRKGMNPSILLPAIVELSGHCNLGMPTDQGEL